MNSTNRRRLGFALMGASALAFIVIQVLSGNKPFEVMGRHDDPGDLMMTTIMLKMDPFFAIPLAACFVAGIGCLAWPERKPPLIST
jgi:hypothetical protein